MSQPPDQPPPPPGQGWGPPPGPPGPPGRPGPPGYGVPPPYGAQPPYAAPYGYPYGGARQTEGTAIAVLILAIASFVFCPVIPAIVALAMAPGAKGKIAESRGAKDGEGLITAGVIIAWINLACAALFLIGAIAIVAASGPNGYG